MRKMPYLREEDLDRWTGDVLCGLAESKGRTRLPVLDASTALLWLDPQKIFISEESPAFLPAWQAVRRNCLLLAGRARRLGRLMIVTRHVHPQGDGGGSVMHFFGRLLRGDDPLSLLAGEAAELAGDGQGLLEKPRHSAFSSGRLEEIFGEGGIRSVLIMGVQAHLCVLATAVEAGTHDFIPVVVADATAAGSEMEHRAALEALSGGLACLMTTREVMERWH
jgi:nicotinamidase-related amidase